MGVTEVPDEPKRIAVLSPNYVDNLYVYDVIPVLAAESSLTNEKVSSHLPQELYEDVQFIGGDDFNLEAILEAEPDLIIGQDKAGNLRRLSSIAPTVIGK
ncbi:ABC transporter substrate-binding protein [Sinobaca sp. H24]|uniref:ABC transporter substrate-binding protein n=1 Tax=Sinobaca sp. H24 TaxID=2923376 RepID=UPI00207970B5|nr:ABC transporter substrate-binding protein [Sinobaca sp. H24]